MKKTLSRVLSLALALALLIGVVPVALADGQSEGETTQPVTPVVTVTPSATKVLKAEDGKVTVTASLTGAPENCTVSYSWTGATATSEGAATAEVSAATAGSVSVSATATFTVAEDAPEGTVAPAAVTSTAATIQIVDKATPSLNDTAETLQVGDSFALSVTYDVALPEGAVSVISWQSSSNDVATVSSSGSVTAVSEGSATITPVFSDGAGEYLTTTALSATITVSGGVSIKADNINVKVGSSGVISPTLVGAPKDAKVTWSFETANKNNIAVGATSGIVTAASTTGVATVTVTASYKVGDGEAKTVTKDVQVGVYQEHTLEVKVKSSISSFNFAETGVFSETKYDGISYGDRSISYLIAENDGSLLELMKSSLSDNVGTLKIGPWGSETSASMMGLSSVTVTMNGLSGTMLLTYNLKNAADGVVVSVGTIYITTEGYDGDIIYSTTTSQAVTLNESHFYTYFNKHAVSGSLDYVVFDITSNSPQWGTLYTSAAQNAYAASTYKFAYNYSAATDDYDLDAATYVPYSRASKAYVDKIPFTAYSTTAGVSVKGVLAIKVSVNSMNFTDVKKTDYFYDAVAWAVNAGVTTGTSATTFSPEAACTRGQVVTFLWRAAGSPNPTKSTNPFTDVKATDYYYKAVLWAVEKGITTGTSATTFSPNAACTRGQVVTFLWRAANEPSATGTNAFTDVKAADYYATAVRWAVNQGITTGMSATSFAPGATCTRGQIVTFLYRYYV